MLFQQLEISKIEELLKKIVGKPFSKAKSAIEERVDELLEEYGKKLPDNSRDILVIGYYRAAQEYHDAKPRRLGGPYFLHPEQTVAVLIEAGVSDPATLLTGLFHDAVEERLSAFYKELQRKKTKFNLRKNREERYIKEYSNTLQKCLTADFINFGINEQEAQVLAGQVCEPVNLLTRRKKEKYYGAIHRLFDAPSSLSLQFPESQQRAIIVKFADRYANTLDLERADYTIFPPKIHLQDIIDAYAQDDGFKIARLKQETIQYAQDHPSKTEGKFRGDQKLHPCFKNIILLNQYRDWLLAGKMSIATLEGIQLAEITEQVTQKIIDHLCTYHAGNTVLNPKKIYDLHNKHEEYIRSRGYVCVTRPSKRLAEGYDGIVQRFFHAKIRGNTEALKELDHDRSLMFKAAIGFHYLCSQYIKDPQFHLRGLTQSGIQAEPAVSAKKK